MVDLRDSIGWLIGAIGGVGSIILGYLQQYEFLGAILATTIGAGIAYYVQTKTQEKTWKREYAIKVVEEVYVKIFKDLQNTIDCLDGLKYHSCWIPAWRDVKDSHQQLMVEENFKEKMDELQNALMNLSEINLKIKKEIAPKIFNEEAQRAYNEKIDFKPELSVQFSDGYGVSIGTNIINYLLEKKHPKKASDDKGKNREIDNYDFKAQDGGAFHFHDVEKLERFWKSCIERIEKNPTIKFANEENERLLKFSRKMKEQLVKMIKEPWKI